MWRLASFDLVLNLRKRRELMRPLLAIIIGIFIIGTPLAMAQDISLGGGVSYWYFMWSNSDFCSDTDSLDSDVWHTLFLWIDAKAEFEYGVSAFLRVGGFGAFGCPYYCYDYDKENGYYSVLGDPAPAWYLAYIDVDNLFDSPVSMRIGKQPVLYGDGIVAWDGGADGLTGLKLMINMDMVDIDIFTYRLLEGRGFTYWWPVDPDKSITGAHLTTHLMGSNVDLSAYFFMGAWEDCKPMWVGARTTGNFIPGLDHKLEFVKVMGQPYEDAVSYAGMAYIAELNYSPPDMPFGVGGAYLSFSGDDPETDDWEGYMSALGGPFIFDNFFNGFLGFGPAYNHLITGGFCTDPSDLNVINGHATYSADPLTIRGDYFMYSLNQPVEVKTDDGEKKGIGNEIALTLTYDYHGAITFGFSGGYFMPGDLFGDDADAGMAGQIFTSKSF